MHTLNRGSILMMMMIIILNSTDGMYLLLLILLFCVTFTRGLSFLFLLRGYLVGHLVRRLYVNRNRSSPRTPPQDYLSLALFVLIF